MSIRELTNKKTAILGLGREGLSTLKFLKKHGIKADILDAKFDKNYLDKLDPYEVIFRTPGFPRLHPKLLAAEKNGAIISSHIKMFFDLCPAKIIAVTGTKGKTTTTLLIYEILSAYSWKKKYRNVFIAGNFGKPALDILLPKLKKDSLVVLELSSFQLQDLEKSPHVAVVTNITLDHMDPSGKFAPSTHQTASEYFKAKMNIIKYQSSKDFAVLNPALKSKTKNIGQGKKIYPSPLSVETGLKGKHNLENIALAWTVAKILKLNDKEISKIVKKFKGVEHRLEFVKKVNSVSFYNDSAATNPDATLAALKSFNEPVHLIIGGSDKGLDYNKLIKYISKSRNIKTVVLIGELKIKLYKNFKSNPNFQLRKIKTLKDAVLTCFKKSDKNEVVLLSPAAASFDMFQNYANRGEEFKKIVHSLGGRNGRRK